MTCERVGSRVDAGKTLRRPKVRDLQHAAVRVDEHVVSFDVTVHDLVVMLRTNRTMAIDSGTQPYCQFDSTDNGNRLWYSTVLPV